MPFITNGEIRYFQFESFGNELIHAIFTRRGGVSPPPWAGLNLGGTVGDDLQRVNENRLRALSSLSLDKESVFDVWQVHGVKVAIADGPRSPETPHLLADAILTDKPGITLMMRFADCVPILLHDPVRNVAGIVHAGWKGTVLGAARMAVDAMRSRYNSQPSDILAAIGPSIGPDHYQVGSDVVDQVNRAFGEDASRLLAVHDGGTYFDLWSANHQILEQVGIKKIELAGLCTACHSEDWFSHRAEKGRTGRFGVLVALGKV